MHDSNKFLATARLWLMLLCLLGLSTPSLASSEASNKQPVVAHQIRISLNPSDGRLSATDRLSLPSDSSETPPSARRPEAIVIQLHQGLKPEILSGNATLEPLARREHLAHYRLEAAPGSEVELVYQGRLQHDFNAVREGMGRERQQLIGTISPEGVFLSGYSGWYPKVLGTLESVELEVSLPQGWLAVSQGEGPEIQEDGKQLRVGWRETAPQDALYLIAAPFRLYRQPHENGEAQAFLRSDDTDLAARYLEATRIYLDRYSQLIGPYPYTKFALVENFWETGYGMPSFTLLGPQVLRLPFILHSSYPHEILHNWWGNGVYVDDSQGNWSEGLTTYLADHLNQELAGKGANYRRDQLKAYSDFVRDHQDQPLSDFRGRHGAASQAIGYGKALMLFHMLRTQLGDQSFVRGLQRFYRDHRFSAAGWDAIQTAFEAESGVDLSAFFAAWTQRTGAPRLALEGITVEPLDDGRWRLSGRLEQTQSSAPFPMPVPVVFLDEAGSASELVVTMNERSTGFTRLLDARPARIDVDPRFDSFRTLAEGEATASLSNLFGAERGLIVLPADAPAELGSAYRQLAEAWQRGQAGWSIALDRELETMPTDRAIWLLGWRNHWLPVLAAIGAEQDSFALEPAQQRISLLGTDYADLIPVISRFRDGQPLGWIATNNAEAVIGLARKLPHYGKYGYLVFEGSAPTNLVKGQWPAGESSLTQWLSESRPALTYPARPTLLETQALTTASGTDLGN
ncbi:MAG: M1 family aminopeptidase [Lamprobacter sp.]|uniref:M1 family metallopeptidase n=1 Tax=Lamprobacter sp. TaxID=3100796 RepID=UPI002B2627EC|nr:M1 family aminopeptidase [Lamprobacter sp.]MEA3641032.1 M1 family aminopeptidase [Lamprobacter sp.]